MSTPDDIDDAPRPSRSRPVAPPVVLSTTFAFDSAADMARSAIELTPHLYTRWSNPTLSALEERLAALEGAERALVTSSGMAALSLALMYGAGRGGALLVMREVYGGTHELADSVLAPLGVEVRRAPLDDLLAAVAALPPRSMVHVETPTNPTLRVVDLPALRAACPTDTLISIDATFATPLNLRPLEHGADLVVHSATKYLAGHHDVVAGVVCGAAEHLGEIWRLRKLLGPVLDPAAAYRVWRGLETLELRVTRQNATAAELARRLAEHPRVARVHHPSRPEHPDYALAQRLLRGGGGVLSFEVADAAAAARVTDALTGVLSAPSLGGTQTLVSWPAGVSHVALTAEERALSGLPDGLVRLAVGLEPVEALWADLAQALEA